MSYCLKRLEYRQCAFCSSVVIGISKQYVLGFLFGSSPRTSSNTPEQGTGTRPAMCVVSSHKAGPVHDPNRYVSRWVEEDYFILPSFVRQRDVWNADADEIGTNLLAGVQEYRGFSYRLPFRIQSAAWW